MSLEKEFEGNADCPKCKNPISWEEIGLGDTVSDRHDPFGFIEVECPRCKSWLCITPIRFMIEVIDECDLDREDSQPEEGDSGKKEENSI